MHDEVGEASTTNGSKRRNTDIQTRWSLSHTGRERTWTHATHKADDLLAAIGITSWILRQSMETPRRPLDKTHLQLEPSDIDQTERVSEARETGQEMGRRHQFVPTTQGSSQSQQGSHERVLNVSVAPKCCCQHPRYFSPEQHRVRRLHPQRNVRHVVLSNGTTMFQGIFRSMTRN